MDSGFENERFVSLSFKSSVARRFRKYCKNLSKSQSRTLLAMLDFFESNGVTPEDRLGETIAELKSQIRRRFNAVIAIIKDIEKGQTKPTLAMLQSLFEQQLLDVGGEEEPFEFSEKDIFDSWEKETLLEETTVPLIRYQRLEEKLMQLKRDFNYVLDQVQLIKPSLGKPYLKTKLSPEELQKYKRMLKEI